MNVRDISWVFLRLMSRGALPVPPDTAITQHHVVPFWTGYNAQLLQAKDTYRAIAYAPIIDAKPADMGTVFTNMIKCKEMTNHLGQEITVQTMDQQLFAIAQQVKWAEPHLFANTLVRLGGFHTACCFIASLGKIWGDAGLCDLLVDSEVYAAATTAQMLDGKQYNRSIRGLTLAFEAMMEHCICRFMKWCPTEIPGTVWDKLETALSSLCIGNDQPCDASLSDLENELADQVLPLLIQFEEWGCTQLPTFCFWVMFMHVMSVLLMSVRAERDGDRAMHLHTVYYMLRYFFVCDRKHYARWTPMYLLSMQEIPSEVKTLFESGQFNVRQSVGRFNGIWSDLGTEKTIIRDTKSESGIVGLTRKKSALTRWTLTRHLARCIQQSGEETQWTSIKSEYICPCPAPTCCYGT